MRPRRLPGIPSFGAAGRSLRRPCRRRGVGWGRGPHPHPSRSVREWNDEHSIPERDIHEIHDDYIGRHEPAADRHFKYAEAERRRAEILINEGLAEDAKAAVEHARGFEAQALDELARAGARRRLAARESQAPGEAAG